MLEKFLVLSIFCLFYHYLVVLLDVLENLLSFGVRLQEVIIHFIWEAVHQETVAYHIIDGFISLNLLWLDCVIEYFFEIVSHLSIFALIFVMLVDRLSYFIIWFRDLQEIVIRLRIESSFENSLFVILNKLRTWCLEHDRHLNVGGIFLNLNRNRCWPIKLLRRFKKTDLERDIFRSHGIDVRRLFGLMLIFRGRIHDLNNLSIYRH